MSTGIPVATIRNYRKRPPRRVTRLLDGVAICQGCGADPHAYEALDAPTYSYLLGLYLGDGCIGESRGRYQLRISLDDAYPAIIEEAASAMLKIRGRLPGRQVVRNSHCLNLGSGWKSWPCLLPQHGAGRKHERQIALKEWQRVLVDAAPESFIRGLIHSDGCRTINRFKTVLPSGRIAEYEYPRYFFTNYSADILGLFTGTCDALGIRWTRSNHRNISISHRHSVARLDEFVGAKT